jgi:GAF domain-containing protein
MGSLGDDDQALIFRTVYDVGRAVDRVDPGIDREDCMPDLIGRHIELAARTLLTGTTSMLYEYDAACEELLREARAEEVSDACGRRTTASIALGEGEIGAVAAQYLSGEARRIARWSPLPGSHSIAVPMCVGGALQLVGVLTVERGGGAAAISAPPFSAREEALLYALAEGLAGIVQRSRRHVQVYTQRATLELRLELHAAHPNASGLDGAILSMIGILTRILSAERMSIYIADEARQEFWLRTGETDVLGGSEGTCFPFGQGIVGYVLEHKCALNLPDAYRCELFSPDLDRLTGFVTKQVLCVPMLDASGKVIAVIQALNKHGGTACFTTQDERLLSTCCESIAQVRARRRGAGLPRRVRGRRVARAPCARARAGGSVAHAARPRPS